MTKPLTTLANLRREQIVEAAVAVITEQGLQNLSLSEIENKADMSRGQLTYYFPAKEDILLAVFDRLLQLMCHHQGKANTTDASPCQGLGWEEGVRRLLETILTQPPSNPEFHCLQYTFLSQIGHRTDFRRRLATLYEDWRGRMTGHLAADLEQRPPARPVSPRAVATLVQAVCHGLVMQSAADPDAFDREEMMNLCLDVLVHYLWDRASPTKKRQPRTKNKKTTSSLQARRARRPPNGPAPGGSL